MKKNLLIAALVLPLLTVSAQWTQTGGTVSVQPNTLHYMSGTYEVKGGGQAINKGNVNVQGQFTIDETNPNTEFRNVWNNSKISYGQLIINENSLATGTVIAEYKNTPHTQFFKQSFAVPFDGISALELATQAGLQNPQWITHPRNFTYMSSRWENAINMWENSQFASANMKADDIIGMNNNTSSSSSEPFLPTSSYRINQRLEGLDTRLSEYQGKPANMAHSLDVTPFAIDPSSTNYTRNIYGEMLGTYLKDPFVNINYTSWTTPGIVNIPTDFGNNLFSFGNPYTSNLDLRPSLTGGPVTGVIQYMGADFIVDQGSNILVADAPFKATWDNGAWIGDLEALEVRPFHTFSIKTDGTINSIPLGNANKTFDLDYNAPAFVDRTTTNQLFQVKMQLFKNDLALSRAYIVASNSFEAAAQAGNEAYVLDANPNTNIIYTLQENEDGTVSQELINSRVYINGINKDSYVAKPIMLVHQVANPGQFTLKGILSNDLINSSNQFFFEDAEEGFIQNITEDFEYTFTANETTTDRFRIYWNGTPEVLNVSDVTAVAKTLVYKNVDDTFKVRFAENWNKADIFVYNVMGQLVHSAKSVDASIDYTLPLKGHTSAYIVKAVSDKGEVATQKIIKK
ncbi:T9SS type A sorting domain-containing protein [Weeksellaceae bacterium KMM 9713]|uniref:T9SS type A sorting domain-containing protein n=1 Tax=Profundicola chukchiensis TaxID=2961959 RepID=A0A9X4RUL1_9FLAO|nr:T9SS type A sorting domain-containing protein [Profundicola chukchiensis]MDG4944865.1 T9SS type A sorting domain-containing protein [Profundicola chukchiensis]